MSSFANLVNILIHKTVGIINCRQITLYLFKFKYKVKEKTCRVIWDLRKTKHEILKTLNLPEHNQ